MLNEQEKKRILEIINKHGGDQGSLIQVLNMIQEEHGYLPKEVQKLVADEMRIPFSRVYEVTSFYSRFTFEKKGKYVIAVCLGTACYVKGAQAILDQIKERLKISENETTSDGLFTITSSRCVGACALAPVVIVNKDVHGKLTPDKVAGMLEAYK